MSRGSCQIDTEQWELEACGGATENGEFVTQTPCASQIAKPGATERHALKHPQTRLLLLTTPLISPMVTLRQHASQRCRLYSWVYTIRKPMISQCRAPQISSLTKCGGMSTRRRRVQPPKTMEPGLALAPRLSRQGL